MFNDSEGHLPFTKKSSELRACNTSDFKRIYDATMALLFKISYRVVNDEEAILLKSIALSTISSALALYKAS